MPSTHSRLVTFMSRSHQPVGYVAECAKVDPVRLTRFIANEGPLTPKELSRLEGALAPYASRFRPWMWKVVAGAGGLGAAALTTTVQEAVKTLWHLITPTAP